MSVMLELIITLGLLVWSTLPPYLTVMTKQVKQPNPSTPKRSAKLPTPKPVVFDATNEFKQTFDYWDYLLKKISYDRPLLRCEIKFVESFASEVKQIFKNRKEVANA